MTVLFIWNTNKCIVIWILNYKSFYDLISVSTVDDTTTITELKTENEQTMSTTKALVILVVIFSLFILILGYLYYSFPQMTEYVVKKIWFLNILNNILLMTLIIVYREEKKYMKIPRNTTDMQNLGRVLEDYKDTNYTQVFMSIFFCYILYPLNTLKFNYWTNCLLIFINLP